MEKLRPPYPLRNSRIYSKQIKKIIYVRKKTKMRTKKADETRNCLYWLSYTNYSAESVNIELYSVQKLLETNVIAEHK